jgi:hypothetical protein
MLISKETRTMSQLIEKFKQASSGGSQPMGFRAARPATAAPRLLLIAGLTGAPPDKPGDYLEGADAVLLRPEETADEKALRKTAESLDKLPWGLYLEDDSEGPSGKAGKSGPDFVVFAAAGRVGAAPRDEQIGKVLEVESAMDDGLLRAVNDLPVDAVLIADGPESSPLLWHQLMIFQHLANLFPKPLIVPTPADISPDEIKALWEAGVDGILVAADLEKPGGLKGLRQAIDALPPRTGRKGGQARVVLPRSGVEGLPAAPPDEEDDDDDY